MDQITPRFALSPRAQARIKALLAAQKGAVALRVSVLAGGCSGFQYRFALEDAHTPDDIAIGEPDARVVIDPASLDLLAGAELDFVEELMGAYFKVKNPNATTSCGCGTSFAVD